MGPQTQDISRNGNVKCTWASGNYQCVSKGRLAHHITSTCLTWDTSREVKFRPNQTMTKPSLRLRPNYGIDQVGVPKKDCEQDSKILILTSED